MKKMSVNTIVNIVAAALLLVGLIVVEISFRTAQGWFDTNYNAAIIALAVGGAVLLLLIAALNITGRGMEGPGASLLRTLLSGGACACAGVIVGLVLGAIATEFAYTYFSNFNQGTAKEAFIPTACMQAVAGMIIAVVTILMAAIANIFDVQRAE